MDTNLEVLSIQNLKAMRLDEKLSQRSEVNEKRSKEIGTFHETEASGVVAGGGGEEGSGSMRFLFWVILSAVRNGGERGDERLTRNRRTFSLPCDEL